MAFCDAIEVDSATVSFCFPRRRVPPIDHAIRQLKVLEKLLVEAVSLIYRLVNILENK